MMHSWQGFTLGATLFISSLTLGSIAQAQTTSATAAAPDAMRALIALESNRFDVPGIAVAKIDNGQVAWISTQGAARIDQAVDAESVFNVASLTKAMFGTMVVHLVEQDRFSFDAPLAEYWVDPDLAEDSRHEQLTARLALSHQTGLPNWRGNQPLAFQFDPGTRHEYSGEGFEYTRRAIERVTDAAMPELMTELITGPAGMTATHFGWDESIREVVVTGFEEDGSAIDRSALSRRQANAAASTFTTVGDVARFVAWVSAGADLPAEAFAEMTRSQAMYDDPAEYFSIGWRVTTVNGTPVLSHDGREPGLRTLMVVNPTSGDGVVVLTNSSNGELIMRGLVRAVMDGGEDYYAQVDRDVWRFIASQPPAMWGGMLQFVARSPSFSEKLLHAVNTVHLSDAVLSVEQSERADALIDQVLNAHHRGRVGSDALGELFSTLVEASGDRPMMKTEFNVDEAAAWINDLAALLAE